MKQIKIHTQAFLAGCFLGLLKWNWYCGRGAYLGFLAASADPELSAKGYAGLEKIRPGFDWRAYFERQRQAMESGLEG